MEYVKIGYKNIFNYAHICICKRGETMLKRLYAVALILVLSAQLVSCGSKEVLYKAGTYEGIAEGHIGPIHVMITTDEYEIKDIKIMDQQETPVIGDAVYKKIPEKVIKANSADIDGVAGATYTSNGLLKAIKDGLEKAKIKEETNENK